MQIDFTALTDPGRSGKPNQDSALATSLADGSYLLAVADGVGGLARGDVASQMVVSELAASISGAGTDPKALLIDTLATANAKIHALSADGDKRSASTVVAVLVTGDGFLVASAGDSRAYLLRDGKLLRLTEDHSLVADQVRAGILTPEEASRSRHRNIITRSIGTAESVEVDTMGPAEVLPDDCFLLCSDGLHGVVTDREIRQAIGNGRDLEEVAGSLVDLANGRGGPDNISVVLARVR